MFFPDMLKLAPVTVKKHGMDPELLTLRLVERMADVQLVQLVLALCKCLVSLQGWPL